MAPQLDRNAQAILDAMEAFGEPHLATLSVEEARERVRAALVGKRPPEPLPSVEDTALATPQGELRMRIYRPKDGPLPVVLFVHGGGWTVNDIDTHDELCRRLAKRSGLLLASLEYRKAPEHRHPAALQDVYFGYRWLRDNAESLGGDGSRFAVVGESSGGMLTAGLSLLLKNLGAPLPDYQVIAYPVAGKFDGHPSYESRGSGYILDRDLLRWYFDHFVPDGWPDDDPYLYPLAAKDLSGLPRTLLLTAEFDPLRDEGLEYGKRLTEAGVDVEHVHVEDQMHGFLLLGRAVPKAGAMIDRIADSLARLGSD